jgi:hypothetical protein
MIFCQEKKFKTSFDKEDLIPLYPKTLFYSSDYWFIKSGCWAFHKSYLNKIKVGQLNTPKVVQAIREILDIPDAPT